MQNLEEQKKQRNLDKCSYFNKEKMQENNWQKKNLIFWNDHENEVLLIKSLKILRLKERHHLKESPSK